MVYSPVANEAVSSSALYNADIAAGIIRVADNAALQATLANPIPPPEGAFLLQEDNNTLYRRVGAAFAPVLDLTRQHGLARPSLDFITVDGAAQGSLTLAPNQIGRPQFTIADAAGDPHFVFTGGADLLGIGLSTIQVPNTRLGLIVEYPNGGSVSMSANSASIAAPLAGGVVGIHGRTFNIASVALSVDGTTPGAPSLLGTSGNAGAPAFYQNLPLTMLPAVTTANAGQGLVVSSAGLWEVATVATSGGGQPGPPATITRNLHYSSFTAARAAGVMTPGTEYAVTLAADTVDAGQGLSVTGGNVAFASGAGTAANLYTVDYSLEVTASNFVTGANDVTNRFNGEIIARVMDGATVAREYSGFFDFEPVSGVGPATVNVSGSFTAEINPGNQVRFFVKRLGSATTAAVPPPAAITRVDRDAAPAAAVAITAGAGGAYGQWATIMEISNITADEAAHDLSLEARVRVDSTQTPTSGGFRLMTEFQLVRVRGATTTVLEEFDPYGPRNLNVLSGSDFYNHGRKVVFAFPRRMKASEMAAGDTLRLRARMASQQTGGGGSAPVDGNSMSLYRDARPGIPTAPSGGGNNATGISIAAANSHVYISSSTVSGTGGGGGGGGSSTFLGLTDVDEASYTGHSGQVPRVKSDETGLEFYVPSMALSADSVTAAQARLQTLAYRQEWWRRGIYQGSHPNISLRDFNVTSGQATIASVVTTGFSSAIGAHTQIAPTTFRPSGASRSYQVLALTEAAGTIAWTVSPDPGSELSNDYVVEIQGPADRNGIRLPLSDASKAVSGGDAIYSWTGNADIIPGSGNFTFRVLEPLADIHATIPTNFSALAGTVAPDQFRDASIAPTRGIGGTLTQQGQWRALSGFSALNAGNASADSPLFWNGSQIVQGNLDLTDLRGVGVSAYARGLAIWDTQGLQLLPWGNAGQYLTVDSSGNGITFVNAPTTGGAGATAFTGLTGNISLTQLPLVTAADNFKVLEVVGGAWVLQQLPFAALTGNIGAGQIAASTITNAMLAGQIDFSKLDLDNATKQTAARAALGITQGAQTIAENSIGKREIDGDTAAKKADLRNYLGVRDDAFFTRFNGTFTAGTNVSGQDIGYASNAYGTAPATGRTFTIGGVTYSFEEISLGGGLTVADRTELTVVVSPQPPSTGDEDYARWFFRVNGHPLRFSAVARAAATMIYGPAATDFRFDDVPPGLLANGQTFTVEIGGAIEEEIDAEIGNIRGLPAQATTAEYKVLASNSANDWGARTLTIDGSNQAHFTSTISASTVTTQASAVAALTTTTANADIVRRSGNTLTIQKQGLYHITLKGDPRPSNTGSVSCWFKRNNTDNTLSVAEFGYPGPRRAYPPSTVAVELDRNDRITVEYRGEDVPTLATAAPAAPTGLTAALATGNDAGTGNWTATWTYAGTAPSVTSWEIEWRVAGQTAWHSQPAIMNDAVRSVLVRAGVAGNLDFRVRGVNSNGPGPWGTRTFGPPSAFTADTSVSQVIDAIIDITLSRVEPEVA